MTESRAIDICICTFRRAHVAETMRSLTKLEIPAGTTVNVIVADNDTTQSASNLVENTMHGFPFPLTYIHAPATNISIARNACLDMASAPLVAFIDDDELVSKQWLTAMLATYDASKADVVLGPVKALYAKNCPAWIRKGDFHSTYPVQKDGKITTGYAGNVLFNRLSPAVGDTRFRLDLGRCGGEDTAFFATITNAGGRIAYAPDAIVTEQLPASRASLNWLLHRRFRFGQTHGMLLLEASYGRLPARLANLFKASAKMLYCAGMALLCVVYPDKMRFWLLRAALHAGVISRLMGRKEISLYA